MSERKNVSNVQDYQILSVFAIDSCFGDFSKCKNNWVTIDEERARKLLDVTVKSATQLQKAVPEELTHWETVKNMMRDGLAVCVHDTFFREAREQASCPLCGSYIEGDGAISRRDNKTIICDKCAQREAFDDMAGVIR